MDMTVSVGLGTGDKPQQMQAAMAIGAVQDKLFPLGMVSPDNAMATAELVVNAAGQKGVDRFFSKPDPNAPPKPDPEMAKVQAQAQADQAKAQSDAQIKTAQLQQEAQIKTQQTQADAALAQQQLEAEMALKRYQIDQEINLKQTQMAAELELKRQQMTAELALKERISQSASVGQVNVGGEPG
jgi:multidrug efflux pump subunit AcrA (membrane-fusion protein)